MNKLVFLDGAIGTSLWAIADAHGVARMPVWRYNVEHPEFVEELTKRYIDAGAEIVLANTFGANRPAVERASKLDPVEVVSKGVAITKKAAEGTGVKTCLSCGPLTMLLEPYGDLEEDECREIYREMIEAGVGAGADLILLQTFIDLEMMRIAAEEAVKTGLPVFCAMTFEKVGKTMFGNSVQDVIDTLEPLGISAIGMNCSLGPVAAVPIIREFSEKTNLPLLFKPNAGLPITGSDGKTEVAYTPEQFAKEIEPALDFVTYIGGCCGCDDSYVRAIRKLALERNANENA